MTSSLGLVILSGGQGTRVARIAAGRPKALLSVAGVPALAHHLIRSEALACPTFLQVNEQCRGWEAELEEWTDRLRREVTILRTHGDLSVALRQIVELGMDHVLLVNADVLSDVDHAALYRAFRAEEAGVLTVSSHAGADRGRQVPAGWFSSAVSAAGVHNLIGISVVRCSLLEKVAARVRYDFWGALHEMGGAEGAFSVRVLESSASWRDVGTEPGFLAANLAWRSMPFLVDPYLKRALVRRTESGSLVSRSASVAGAELRDCVVGAGARVPAGTRLSRCLVLPGTAIEAPGYVAEGMVLHPAFRERIAALAPQGP